MATNSMVGKIRERFWKVFIPKQYKGRDIVQIQKEYNKFYHELKIMFGDITISRGYKEKFFRKHEPLIRTVKIYEKRLKDPVAKLIPDAKKD